MSFGGVAREEPETMNGTALFAIVLPPLTISRNALPGMPGGTTNDRNALRFPDDLDVPAAEEKAGARGNARFHDDASSHGSHFRLELEPPFAARDGGGEEDPGEGKENASHDVTLRSGGGRRKRLVRG